MERWNSVLFLNSDRSVPRHPAPRPCCKVEFSESSRYRNFRARGVTYYFSYTILFIGIRWDNCSTESPDSGRGDMRGASVEISVTRSVMTVTSDRLGLCSSPYIWTSAITCSAQTPVSDLDGRRHGRCHRDRVGSLTVSQAFKAVSRKVYCQVRSRWIYSSERQQERQRSWWRSSASRQAEPRCRGRALPRDGRSRPCTLPQRLQSALRSPILQVRQVLHQTSSRPAGRSHTRRPAPRAQAAAAACSRRRQPP